MIPYHHRVSTQCATGDYCEPQWPRSQLHQIQYSAMNISTTNVTSSSDSVNGDRCSLSCEYKFFGFIKRVEMARWLGPSSIGTKRLCTDNFE
jgi:hypothetical protein